MLVSGDTDLYHVHHNDLNRVLDIGVDKWFQIYIVNNCQWVYVTVRGIFCQLVDFLLPLLPQWLGIQQKWTSWPLSLNDHRRVMVWQMRFSVFFTLNRLQAEHGSRLPYHAGLGPCTSNSSVLEYVAISGNIWSMQNSLRTSDAYKRQSTNHQWCRKWLGAWLAPSHYLNQCCNIVNSNFRNKFQWNRKRNSYIFIHENVFENVVC